MRNVVVFLWIQYMRRFHIRKPSGGSTRGACGFALYRYVSAAMGKAACDVVVKVFVFLGLCALIMLVHMAMNLNKFKNCLQNFVILQYRIWMDQSNGIFVSQLLTIYFIYNLLYKVHFRIFP